MPSYVEISVNVPKIVGVFHYHLPAELEEIVKIGHLVTVPFGKQEVQGVVLRFIDHPAVEETRPVLNLIDPAAVLTSQQIVLGQHMSKEYLAPLADCIALMLPAGLPQHSDVKYKALGAPSDGLSKTQIRLLKLLNRRGPLRSRQIDRSMPHTNWRSAVPRLEKNGLISKQSVLPQPKVQPKLVRTAQLACPLDIAKKAIPNLGKANSKALKRRQTILQFLMREAGPFEVTWLYAESGGNISDLRFLYDRGLIVFGESQIWRDPLDKIAAIPDTPPPLTKDQEKVIEILKDHIKYSDSVQKIKPFLLHGVTGSGKTEIYLNIVKRIIQQGKQAIVLVPEISLTPQTVNRFMSRFPGLVGLIHSGLSVGERYDTWRRARAGKLKVIVGPRSALFVPFAELGLIVVDESHDDSYYQTESSPHYHARQTAIAYSQISGALCILGSATPDIKSTYYCRQGNWNYLKLPNRILAHRQTVESQIAQFGGNNKYRKVGAQTSTIDLPPVQIVDMRDELKSGNRSIFSRLMQNNIKKVLDLNQQAILFLNRRGSATYIFCRDCGHSLICPNCSMPLTYHVSKKSLLCHHCGYKQKLPHICPKCDSIRIRHYGTGTQKVETEIQKLFPHARILRWDYDTTRKKGSHQAILSHFLNRRADILVGTQMLAKGLDVPLVTLVGVVLAEVGLNLPDYRANERVFQVLSQVSGRAGRSPLGGNVVLQTFQPQNHVIQAAATHNYKAFFDKELSYRRKLGYPPFTRLVRLEYQHSDSLQAEKISMKLRDQLKLKIKSEARRATRLIGPVPCFFERSGRRYRWQIVLSGPDPVSILEHQSLQNWIIEVDPPSLL